MVWNIDDTYSGNLTISGEKGMSYYPVFYLNDNSNAKLIMYDGVIAEKN